MDFEKRSAELARRIAAAQRRGRRGKVYAPELRRDIESYLQDRMDAGGSPYGVAPELGISLTTLVRWRSQARRDAGLSHLRPVSVLPMPPTLGGAMSVHGPRGLRIEGLDFDGVVELFRRLA
jgi:hypothetical protein